MLSILAVFALEVTFVGQAGSGSTPMAALKPIDRYEAEVERVISHIGKKDFLEVKKNSQEKQYQNEAIAARDKVTDPDLRDDLGILLKDASSLWVAASGLMFNQGHDQYAAAVSTFHSDRELVAGEIQTGKKGQLRQAKTKKTS